METRNPGKNGNGNVDVKRKVTLYPTRRVIEVVPGLKVAPLPIEEIPEIAIAKLQAVGDGTYRPILVTLETNIRLTTAAKVLHVPYHILLRLVRAGFIRSTQPSPGFHQMSLDSWFEHMRALRDDADFWLNEKNRRRYREAV